MMKVGSAPCLLTIKEKDELRLDMAASSAWARSELKRRREEKAKKAVKHCDAIKDSNT